MNITNLLNNPSEDHDTSGLKLVNDSKFLLLDHIRRNTQPSARRGMQFLLCDVSAIQSEDCNGIQNEQRPVKKLKLATATTLSVVPDKERKRSYRLSAKRRQCRLDNEALASRTYNLTLDVNNLEQQVRYLQECRDLCEMRGTREEG
ncbi:hypothetical protein PF008_g26367 [Phytophthora fragariae]|uniref:Uncharacterized protein n=1 Tax=Phytophthora fragariae TaxID=53985 RepID=A0A6G0QHB7_9STRA|nr:hypothetical protein PF008_g26367 [Phytophthora fragariae]